MARTKKTYTKATPTYVDVDGITREGMTQQEYEDNRINTLNNLAQEYMGYRNKIIDEKTGKTADQLYNDGIALMNSDKFMQMSPEKQKMMVDLLEGERKKLGYDFFEGADSNWNRGDNLSRAGVNRNKFAQQYGYKDRQDLYSQAQSNPSQLPKSIYDHSVNSNNNNPLAGLTQNQLNALAFQAAAGTEFKDQQDLSGVINQINQWNGRNENGSPINNVSKSNNGTYNVGVNNGNQITAPYGSSIGSNNMPNGVTYTGPNQTRVSNGYDSSAPLASGIWNTNTAIAPGFGERGGSEVTNAQAVIPNAVSKQGGTGGGLNMAKFGVRL